jgi:5'-nucleotidase
MSKKAGMSLVPKKQDGTPMESRAEALPDNQSGPYILPPKGSIDKGQVVHGVGAAASMEIKEWRAIMNYLKSLPTKNENGITMLVMDEGAKENRSREASEENVHA